MRARVKSTIIGVVAMMVATAVPSAFGGERGEKTFGVRTGYVSRNNSMDLGLFFQYTFSEYFRLQPSADLVFRHQDRDAFTIDLNGQVPLNFNTETFS